MDTYVESLDHQSGLSKRPHLSKSGLLKDNLATLAACVHHLFIIHADDSQEQGLFGTKNSEKQWTAFKLVTFAFIGGMKESCLIT